MARGRRWWRSPWMAVLGAAVVIGAVAVYVQTGGHAGFCRASQEVRLQLAEAAGPFGDRSAGADTQVAIAARELPGLREQAERLGGDADDVVAALADLAAAEPGSSEARERATAFYRAENEFRERFCRDTSYRSAAHPLGSEIVQDGAGRATEDLLLLRLRDRQ